MIIRNKIVKATLLAIPLVMVLIGCSSPTKIPKVEDERLSHEDIKNKLIEEWRENETAVTYINDGGSFSITEPLKIPAEIANRKFKSSLSRNLKMSDLAGLLSPLGIYVSIPDKNVSEKPLVIFDFSGNLGDFLSALGAAHQVSFNWNAGNIITVEESSLYMVKIPHDKDVATAITKSITNLGGSDVDISLEAGAVSYKADYRAHQRISNFIEHVSNNAALVSMQVAIISVSLDRDTKTGIDWSKLNLHIGEAAATAYAKKIGKEIEDATSDSNNTINGTNNNNSSGNSNSNSNSESEDETASQIEQSLLKGKNWKDTQAYSKIGGQSSALSFIKGDFAIEAVIDYLSTYGKTETSQSLLMKTISGKEVNMKSAQEIPYIDSVGVSNIGGSSNGNNNNGLGLGTTDVETIDVGLTLKLMPFFQLHSELVTIGVDLKLSSLLAMVTLSAGNQIGTITRPNTQEQEFNDIVKIKAGETVVIGGITYDQRSDNRNSLPIFQNIGGAHKDATYTRQAMIIMIRPTVTVFKNLDPENSAGGK